MTPEEQLLQEHRVFYHFDQVCQIPHGSGNEKALSDELLRWAKGLGLEAEQDAVNNVLIRKPASPGYEGAPAVMLQAHMDMVCEKAEGVEHDFAADPIRWEVKGDVISTGGRTTLGADDGIGVALAMAILEADDLPHPALEVLFTTCEEDDFSGALGCDGKNLHADYLINLDNTEEHTIVCGSCGGMQVDFRLPLPFMPVPETGWSAYRLTVSGLRGGHSGEDIHRGRGSANSLLCRLLMALDGCAPFFLSHVKGGSYRLAIPREAEAVLWLADADLPAVKDRLAALEQDFRAELALTADSVAVSLAPTQAEPFGAPPAPVITVWALMPDGIFQMNEALTGLVDTSDNLGEVYLDRDNGLHMVLEIRSARNSLREYLFQRMKWLATLLGGSVQGSNPYPSWDFRPQSKLSQLYSAAYRARTGHDPTRLTVHAGLEVGCLFKQLPHLDAISVGPDCWDFHSPTEAMRVSSVKNVYQYLCDTLAAMR